MTEAPISDLATARTAHFAEHPYGWVVAGVATVAMALAFGANISVSVFINPLEAEFGWLRADISMAYTVSTVGAALGGLLWGSLSDRIGARKIAFIGAVSIAGGLMLLGQQRELWAVYVIYFVMGGLGFACLFTPLVALVGLWFDKNKGLAIGIVTAGGAIGQGIVPVILRMLISASDWRDAALYLGLGYLALLLPLLLLLKPPPVLEAAAAQVSRSDDNLWGVSHKVTIPWLAFAGIFCCICMAVPIVHLVPLATGIGLSGETAVSLLFALMASGMVGRLFFGLLADRVGGLYAYFTASATQTAMVFWFTQTDALAALYVLAIVFGFGYAGVMTTLVICSREAAPLRITGFGVAVVTTTAWIGMGIGSYQGGYFYDLTGNYAWSYANAAIAGTINLSVVALLIWYRRIRTGGWQPGRLQAGPAISA